MFKVLSALLWLPILAWTRADFSAWKDSTRIFINTTPAGANVTTPVYMFPLLVRLDANSLSWDKVQAGGADLRFADPDGSLLSHEVEVFNASTRQAAIWVRVPLVDALSATDHIVMYWNNPSASSVSKGSAVFDTALGYVGVWHFGEMQEGIGTKDLYKDATGNANHGDDFASADRSTAMVGFGQDFDGVDDRVQIDNSPSVAVDGPLSISAWVKADWISMDLGNNNPIVRKGDANPNSYQLGLHQQKMGFILDHEDGGGLRSKTTFEVDKYYHVAATWEGKVAKLYVNGVLDAEAATTLTAGSLSKDARPLYIGGRVINPNDASSRDRWDGDIDEVRLARVAHTPQHVKLSYENQKSGSSILSMVPFPPPVSVPDPVKEDLSLWPKSRKIFMNTTDQGAAVNGSVSGFPLLVRLDTSRFKFSEALAGGRDIRFSDPDGTALPHSIERWDVSTGKAEIWVRVPKVDGNSATDHVKMHWGNPLAAERNLPAGVFDTADGFVGVWHLDRSEGGLISGANGYRDQTAFSHHARDYAAADPAEGYVGLGQAFGAGSDRLQVASNDRLAFKDSLTFSAWIRGKAWDPATTVTHPIIRKGEANPNTYQFAVINGYPALYLDEGDEKGIRGKTLLAGNRWYHVAATWGGGKVSLYVDGKADVEAPVARPAPILKDTRSLFIGGRDSVAGAGNDQFLGMLDEVQVAGPARSADWIKLAYESQRSDSRLLAFDALPKDTGSVTPKDTVPKDTTKPVAPRIPWTWDTTLVQGGEIKDSAFTIYNTGPSDIRVVITPAGDSIAKGVIGVEAIFRFIQAGGPMPAVIMTVDTSAAAGRSLYQLLPGVDGWATLGDWGGAEGSHEIFYPGSYVIAKDTTLPRLRILDEGVEGDSSWASVVVEDNIKHVFVRCFPSGTEETLLSRREHSGIPFRLSFMPVKEPVPPKVSLSVDDGRQQSAFPPAPALAYALARRLADLDAPVSAEAALQWGLYGLPVRPVGGRTMRELAEAAGTERLYGAIWNPDPEDAVKGDYRMLEPTDTIPYGTGIWLAGETPFRALPMGEARSFAQGSSVAYSLRLSRGWNLVTSPALEKLPWVVSKQDLAVYDQSQVKGLHSHSAEDQYADADTLEPWKGYFVYSRIDTVLELSPEGSALRKPSSPKAAAGALMGSAGPAIQVFLEPMPGRDGRLASPVPLRLGAAAYASDALEAEDEFMPASPSRGYALGASRARRGLRTDLLSYRPGRVHAWKLAWNGRAGSRPAGGRLRVSGLGLPEGMELRAISAFASSSTLLEEGAPLEISGEAADTLVIWAAPKGSWKEGDPVPGLSPRPAKLSLAFRNGPEGGFLWLALPEASSLRLRAHSADGRRLASLDKPTLAPGYHAIPLASAGNPPRGLLFVTVELPGLSGGHRAVLKVFRP